MCIRDRVKSLVQKLKTTIEDGVHNFKQKTAYEIMSGDWSSDVCSSDLKPSPLRTSRIIVRINKINQNHD